MAQSTHTETDTPDLEDETSNIAKLVENLNNKTPAEREIYFRKAFARNVAPLSSISAPEICESLPDFHEDILHGYFHSTTFTANVWVNYDTASRKFFADERDKACGILRLSKAEKEHLDEFDAGGLEVYRVRLMVGTPFRTLCHITLRTAPSTTDFSRTLIVARLKSHTDAHPDLIEFVRTVCDWLDEGKLRDGTTGFKIGHLQQIASLLCCRPSQMDLTRTGRFSSRSQFMDLSDWCWNYGYFNVPANGWQPGGQRLGDN